MRSRVLNEQSRAEFLLVNLVRLNKSGLNKYELNEPGLNELSISLIHPGGAPIRLDGSLHPSLTSRAADRQQSIKGQGLCNVNQSPRAVCNVWLCITNRFHRGFLCLPILQLLFFETPILQLGSQQWVQTILP